MNSTRSPLRAGAVVALALLVCIGSVLASPLPKPTGYFVRAAGVYAVPDEDDTMDPGPGFLTQIGVDYGSGEFALEIGQVWFSEEASLDTGEGVYSAEGDFDVTPFMLSGRYAIDLTKDKKVRLFFGAFGGLAHTEYSISVREGGTLLGEIDAADWVGIYGVDVGLVTRLSAQSEFTAGARYGALSGGSYDFDGLIRVETESARSWMFYAGLGLRL